MKMTSPAKIILRIIVCFVAAFAVTSCSIGNDQKHYKVMVIHSWSDSAEDGVVFPGLMEEAFRHEGLENVEIRHVYLDMVRQRGETLVNQIWPHYADSIIAWLPDVILINDDPFLNQVLKHHISDDIFLNIPVVFSGINDLMRDSLYRYPLMTGFVDQIDIARNIEVVKGLTGLNSLAIELDHTLADERLRKRFHDVLSDTTIYVDNDDFHLPTIDSAYVANLYPGKIVVSFISCATPETNRIKGTDISGLRFMSRMLRKSRDLNHLQVKRDLFSHTLIDHSRRPQFTCIREQFNNPKRTRFLAGYFTSVQTQVADQVRYAVKILNGVSPKTLTVGLHEQGYYMDYNAMQMMESPMSYDQYCEKFTIINAPFRYRNPVLFTILIISALVLCASFLVLVFFVIYKWRKRGIDQLMEDLLYEDQMNQLLFTKKSDTIWVLQNGIMHVSDDFARMFGLPGPEMTRYQLREMVDEESLWALNTLLDYRNQRGRKSIRFHVTPNAGRNWFWIEVIYTATEESSRTGVLYGILINIDDKKAIEDQLTDAQRKNSEVALKESFLANISHDLRTPLNAITGFSSLLTADDIEVPEEDRHMFCTIIHQNTEMILSMIEGIVQKSQIESGDVEIIRHPKSVTELIHESFLTNKVIAPAYLKFRMENDYPDCLVDVDATRTKQVINNFLSNAFKFTIEGSVVLGWRHIKNEDLVEIYVRDTGVGVSKEKQQRLFDRFYKENEHDRGTGLGLDISKTIVEKQGGTIGVKSEIRKGSTFFIRMQRHISILLTFLCMALGALTSSCSFTTDNHRHAHVLVVHGYDDDISNYKLFDEAIANTFDDYGVDVEIKNIYLGLAYSDHVPLDKMNSLIDSVCSGSWNIDVILSEGDRPARVISECLNSIPRFRDVPMVFGALHHPDWAFIRQNSQIVPIYEPIDYCTNINLAVELTGINRVEIELDYGIQDSIIREELREAIARPPYIDNTDFSKVSLRDNEYREQWKDSIVVTTISASMIERNISANDSTHTGDLLNDIYSHSWVSPALSVKRDLYSFTIVDWCNRPQFTAVKAGFAEGNGRFLAGYFAGYTTVGTDLAATASKVLAGADPRSFVGLKHKCQYYMDYLSMEALGYSYYDYSGRFTIVGAPMHYSQPLKYYGAWTIGILVFVGLFSLSGWLLMRWHESAQNKLMDTIMHKAEIRKLCLRGVDSHTIKNVDDLEDILGHIHPEQSDLADVVRHGVQKEGQYTYEFMADINDKESYNWWQLRFVIIADKKGRLHIDGILFNIDDSKKYEEDLRVAMKLAEEAKQKENFIKTISHEIRTPLNAVVGFSDVLASTPADELSSEEVQYLKSTINENNDRLKAMIEDILMFSRVESGSLKYIKEDISLSNVIDVVEEEWLPKVPSGVKFIVDNHRSDIQLHTDYNRLHYIINQLMANAVKFTTQGFINIRYSYDYDNDKVTITVEDTGCGISKDKRHVIFGLFWKNDNFVHGLGLGLNVAQKLASGIGATITVNSKENCGSSFSITLSAALVTI